MRRRQRMIAAALGGLSLLGVAGCQTGFGTKRPPATEPSLAASGDAKSGLIAESPPPRSVTVADRHPLLAKPRELYDKPASNNAVKVVRATVIGVPLGIFGELKQIVVGVPSTTPAPTRGL